MRPPSSWRIKALGTVLLISALTVDGRPNAPPLRTKDVAQTQSLIDTPTKALKSSKFPQKSSLGVSGALRASGLQSNAAVGFADRRASAAGLSLAIQQNALQFRTVGVTLRNGPSDALTDLIPTRPDISVDNIIETASSPSAVAPVSAPGPLISDLHAAAFSSLQDTWRTADILQLSVSQRRNTQDALSTMHLWAREITGERLNKAVAGNDDLAMLVAGGLRRIESLLGSKLEPSWSDENEETDPYEAAHYEATRLLRLMPVIEQRLAFLEGEDLYEYFGEAQIL